MVQEYDFFIEHIAGKANVAADGFSRLLQLHEETLCLHEEFTIPKEEYAILCQVHCDTVGHHGVDRTMDKLTRLGKHWKYMREHVKRFIKQCPCCQKMSYLRTPIHTHPFTTACYEPMERLEIDVIGPLPEDENGNRFILVIICYTLGQFVSNKRYDSGSVFRATITSRGHIRNSQPNPNG